MKTTATKPADTIAWHVRQLLISKETGSIVLSSGIYNKNDESFEGVFVHVGHGTGRQVGEYEQSLNQSVFVPFHGIITIEN